MIKSKCLVSISLLLFLSTIISPAYLNAQENLKGKKDSYYDKLPEFPGGNAALQKFIVENLKYPFEAKKNGIEGKVVAMFTVNTEGNIEKIRIVKSLNPDLDNEVIRLIKSMPKWEPAETIITTNGVTTVSKVKTYYTLPVNFHIGSRN